jgi:hypothetical protein
MKPRAVAWELELIGGVTQESVAEEVGALGGHLMFADAVPDRLDS